MSSLYQLEKMLFFFCFNLILFAQSGEDDFSNLNYTSEIYNRGSSAAAFLEIGVGARATALVMPTRLYLMTHHQYFGILLDFLG